MLALFPEVVPQEHSRRSQFSTWIPWLRSQPVYQAEDTDFKGGKKNSEFCILVKAKHQRLTKKRQKPQFWGGQEENSNTFLMRS